MNANSPFSLTPTFRWVLKNLRPAKPFQRFCARARETVETVFVVMAPTSTRLKPGVNEIGFVSQLQSPISGIL
jgi:hypothetical protein